MTTRQSVRMILAQTMAKRALFPHSATSAATLWASISRHRAIRDLWLGAADEALAALSRQGYAVTDERVTANGQPDE